MEPEDLNPPFSTQAAAVEKMLSQPGDPIPDQGFSLRVLAALPPAQPRRSPRLATFNSQRILLCALGGLIGLWLSWDNAVLKSFATAAWTTELSQAWPSLVSASNNGNLLTMALVIIGSILYAFLSAGKETGPHH